MKRIFYFLLVAITATFVSCKDKDNDVEINPGTLDSLVSGAGYANDVYYSLKNGVVKTAERSNWDLAFGTGTQDISIWINAGIGDSLFLWKGGAIADFNNEVTLDNKKHLATQDSAASWFGSSAFEQNVNPNNSMDFGWGTYDMATHSVMGDSVYILKLSTGVYKKIALVQRSGACVYTFKVADLAANSTATEVTLKVTDYATKNFVYYSVINNAVVDREPAKTDWDFVFTKYEKTSLGYLVTGILTNEGVQSVKLASADSTTDYSKVTFVKNISNIGYDWKKYSSSSGYYITNPYYFIKTTEDKVYRLKFSSFTSSTGVTKFRKLLLN